MPYSLTAANLDVGSSSTNALKEALTRDLEGQRKAAEVALAEAKKIDEALTSPISNPELLKEAKETLLKVAQLLAANTTATSSAVLEIVSSPLGKSK